MKWWGERLLSIIDLEPNEPLAASTVLWLCPPPSRSPPVPNPNGVPSSSPGLAAMGSRDRSLPWVLVPQIFPPPRPRHSHRPPLPIRGGVRGGALCTPNNECLETCNRICQSSKNLTQCRLALLSTSCCTCSLELGRSFDQTVQKFLSRKRQPETAADKITQAGSNQIKPLKASHLSLKQCPLRI